MAALGELITTVDKLEKFVKYLRDKDEKYAKLTINISDDTNDFDQNISTFLPQTKEERDAKKKRNWLFNGHIFWTNGAISVAKKADEVPPQEDQDDLPF